MQQLQRPSVKLHDPRRASSSASITTRCYQTRLTTDPKQHALAEAPNARRPIGSQRPSKTPPPPSGMHATPHGRIPGNADVIHDNRGALGLQYLWRSTAGPGDLDSLGAAVIARLDEELHLLTLCQAAEALGDDAGLHSTGTVRRCTYCRVVV